MNKKTILIISCLLIVMMAVTSCTSPAKDLMEGIKPMTDDVALESMDKGLNQDILNFTWNMFRESSRNSGNIMISPPSVYLSLAMTLNGADGETKAEMIDALSAQGLSEQELNAGLRYWMSYLMSDDRIAKLSIANSIWYREGFEVDEAFLQKNADYFKASAKTLDFSDKSAADTINKWVKDSTNNKIDKIVEEIDDNTMMYLINAIYFKGDWKDQFKANNTYKMPFKAPIGTVDTDFMNRRGEIDYIEGSGATGVVLPYLDEQFAFVGILPDESQSPRDLINSLTSLDLISLLNSAETKTIDLSLPKFESSYDDSLKNELSKLGMEIAFDPNVADFSLMKSDRVKDLFISEVIHKTFIRVDEKGTEAAAVTSVEVSTTSMPAEVQRVVFDRPFVYGVVDVTTGIPLFIGIMENPTLE